MSLEFSLVLRVGWTWPLPMTVAVKTCSGLFVPCRGLGSTPVCASRCGDRSWWYGSLTCWGGADPTQDGCLTGRVSKWSPRWSKNGWCGPGCQSGVGCQSAWGHLWVPLLPAAFAHRVLESAGVTCHLDRRGREGAADSGGLAQGQVSFQTRELD